MNTVVIYGHPYEKSFNNAVLETVIEGISNKKHDYQIIDLYRDEFNPAYTSEELRLFSSGKTNDQLVSKYQEMIKKANRLIFIFPIWWNDLPAIVKGFLDKVMKKNFAYHDTKIGIKGNLNNIESVLVFTTATSPKWYLKLFAGNAIKKVFIKSSLKQMGIKKSKWYHLGNIGKTSLDKRKKYLERIKKSI